MQFSFKHMDVSEAVKDHAQETFQNILDKIVLNYTSVNVTFSVNKKFFSIHISLHASDGFQLELEQNEEDMHVAIDNMADKLERQLRKHKEKIRNHKGEKHEILADSDLT